MSKALRRVQGRDTDETTQLSLRLGIPGELTKTGLTLKDGISYEDWEKVGSLLRSLHRCSLWWLGDWLNYGEAKWGEMYTQALEETDYDYQTLANCKWVAGSVKFSRRRENLSFSAHGEVASLPVESQDKWLELAESNSWGHKELRDALRRERREVAARKAGKIPNDTYGLIYADPPWRFSAEKSETRAIDEKYPTLSVDEISALRPSVADDAMLFLWVPNSMLPDGLRVLEDWGFVYRSCMVWVKSSIGMGWYFRNQHETLLVGEKGAVDVPDPERRRPSVLVADVPKVHSKKPLEVYEIIEAMYPEMTKLELFARHMRDGWDAWGTDV